MTWMMTCSGQKVDLQNLDTATITINDIAHHLATINRYTGAAVRPYSVAEHSLLVVEIMEREGGIRAPDVLLAGLLHDAHEALVTDVSSPMKETLAALAKADGRQESDWARIEDDHAWALRKRFAVAQVSRDHAELLRWADLMALSTEWAQLMPCNLAVPSSWTTHPAVDWVDLRSRDGMTWQAWREAFVDKFDELQFGKWGVAV